MSAEIHYIKNGTNEQEAYKNTDGNEPKQKNHPFAAIDLTENINQVNTKTDKDQGKKPSRPTNNFKPKENYAATPKEALFTETKDEKNPLIPDKGTHLIGAAIGATLALTSKDIFSSNEPLKLSNPNDRLYFGGYMPDHARNWDMEDLLSGDLNANYWKDNRLETALKESRPKIISTIHQAPNELTPKDSTYKAELWLQSPIRPSEIGRNSIYLVSGNMPYTDTVNQARLYSEVNTMLSPISEDRIGDIEFAKTHTNEEIKKRRQEIKQDKQGNEIAQATLPKYIITSNEYQALMKEELKNAMISTANEKKAKQNKILTISALLIGALGTEVLINKYHKTQETNLQDENADQPNSENTSITRRGFLKFGAAVVGGLAAVGITETAKLMTQKPSEETTIDNNKISKLIRQASNMPEDVWTNGNLALLVQKQIEAREKLENTSLFDPEAAKKMLKNNDKTNWVFKDNKITNLSEKGKVAVYTKKLEKEEPGAIVLPPDSAEKAALYMTNPEAREKAILEYASNLIKIAGQHIDDDSNLNEARKKLTPKQKTDVNNNLLDALAMTQITKITDPGLAGENDTVTSNIQGINEDFINDNLRQNFTHRKEIPSRKVKTYIDENVTTLYAFKSKGVLDAVKSLRAN